MANIIGEPLSEYVYSQINARQKAHGSGTSGNYRTPEQIAYLNSKTAWVKMASGVMVTPKRLLDEKDSANHSINSGYAWDILAQNFVLFGGISEYIKGTGSNDGYLKPRGTYNSNNIYGWNTGTYSVNPYSTKSYSPTGEFGLAPMPGIESVDIKCQNRGSTKKVSVKLKCYTPEQFKVIDLLYLRIGYTMFIEWGWAPYLDNNDTLIHDYATLMESSGQGFFNKEYWKNKSYIDFSKTIEGYREGKNGNYDGLLCKVTNFSWTFSQDGTYDIDIQLISLGDVIESLKTNVTPSYKLTTEINALYKLFNDEYSEEETKESPPSPVNNIISAYFFLQKVITYKNGQNGTNKYWEERQIPCRVGGTELQLCGVFVQDPNSTELIVEEEYEHFYSESALQAWLTANFPGATKIDNFDTYKSTNTPGTYYHVEEAGLLIKDYFVYVKSIVDPSSLNTSGQKRSDIIYLNYNTREDDEDVINDMGFYIRFGHLLDFIKERVIPRIKGTNKNTPILDIDSGRWSNYMYAFPYQVSLDPRVCIVHTKDKINTKEYFTSLPVWKKEGVNYAYPMNIYLNFNKINEIISSNLDEKGNLALFDFISSICTEVNKALGGVNNLEPVIDEVTNKLKIIDGSYSSEEKSKYALELYGYNSNNPAQPGKTVSNFVRDFSIKTEITNDFATMATIGSTAGGYVKGTENTMFSKWNKGIIDRFKEEIVPADKNATETYNGRKDPNASYYEEFWTKRYGAFGLTIPLDIEYDVLTGDQPALDDTIIDKNVAIVTEFYKYCQSELQKLDEKYASTANGFVPISLSLTMDGLSGIKIYNALNVVTRVLPSNYPDALKFIVKGVNHKISKNDWETTIETVVISNSDSDNKEYYKPNTTFVKDEIKQGSENKNENKNENNSAKNSQKCGCTGPKTSYPELPLLNPCPDVHPTLFKDMANLLKSKLPGNESLARAIFGIIWSESSKIGTSNADKDAFKGKFKDSGGYNFSGVQTDTGRWGGGASKYITGRYTTKDAVRCREFASFSSMSDYLDFMISRANDKGFNGFDQNKWVKTYICKWWNPSRCKEATPDQPVFKEKLSWFQGAMRRWEKLKPYG